MCQSFAEGNLKCSGCTRPLYDRALAAYLGLREWANPNLSLPAQESAREEALLFLREAARPFAYSIDGLAALAEGISRAAQERDFGLGKVLEEALAEGCQFHAAWRSRTPAA